MRLRGAWGRLRHGARLARRIRAAQELPVLLAGLELGLFESLREARSAEGLAARHGLAPDLVEAWLRAAHAQGLVQEEAGTAGTPRAAPHWRTGGFPAWLLDDPDAEALQALLGQVGRSHAPLLARIPALMKGAPRPASTAPGAEPETARRVAAASRLTEPAVLRALRRVPGTRRARRILDVGCGHATVLAALLARRRDARGVGIELDPDVAEEARRRLAEAQVSRRAEIRVGDALTVPLPEPGFDLALVSHAFPYFGSDERDALLRRLRQVLVDDGVLAIQTPCADGGALPRRLGLLAPAAAFDLFLRAHRDLHGLPSAGELHARLREAGFAEVGEVPLLPGGALRLVWGRGRAEPRPG